MTASVLDDVPGLGPTRRKALLATFGSVKRLRAAGVDEIAAVRGMGRRTAEAVVTALGRDGGTAAAAPDTTPDTSPGAVTDDASSAPTSQDAAGPGMLGA